MEFVSVIMATYNGNGKLSQAIESILNQTHQNFELIICNDFSENLHTTEILNQYKFDSRIVHINNDERMGAAYSRNKCILKAKGQILIIMDDDDISANDRIEKMVNFLNLNSTISFAGSFANIIGENYRTTLSLPLIPRIADVFNSRAFIHASIIIRRDAIEKVGLYTVNEATNRLEDYDLFCKLFEQGIVGKNIPEYLYDISEGASWNKRRTVSFRIREFKLRYYWFKRLKLSLVHLPILLKPLILAFLPQKIYNFIRSKNR